MIIVLIVCTLFSFHPYSVLVNAACTWPPDFVDSTWTDSLKGDMYFTSTTMTGWNVSVKQQHIKTWECITYNASGPFLVMKSTGTFELFSRQYRGYRCLMLEKITDVSYRYFQMDPVQSSASYDRLHVSNDSSLHDIDILCTQQPATGSEFLMMLRKGYEDAAVVTCPYSLLANYEFTYQQFDGTVSCDSTSGVGYVEMCSNVTQFRVTSPMCAPYPFYTRKDRVWCVDVVVVGTDTFVSLYNGFHEASSIDKTNTYRFTCAGINAEGTSMSVTPQHCKANQLSTEVPTDNQGRKVGAVLNLSIDGDTCPPCPLLSNPARGNVVKSTNGAVTKATYSCEGNYTLIGNDTRICQGDGTWSGSEPSCICPNITSFLHGSVTSTTDELSLTFTCDAGYVLVGEAALTCNTDTNTWSNTIPTCVACLTLTDIANGNITLWSNSSTTIATYHCATGYMLSGENISVCTTTGIWDSAPPICVCNGPSPPGNGSVTMSDDLSEVVYTCGLGFTIQGPSTRNCQSGGSGWSNTDPVCVECPALSETGGIFTLSTNGTTTTAKLTCARGYVLFGSDTIECQSNGSWTSSSTQAECASTSDPSDDNSSSLNVAIVAAALTGSFAAALGGLVYYIRKLKKNTMKIILFNK